MFLRLLTEHSCRVLADHPSWSMPSNDQRVIRSLKDTSVPFKFWHLLQITVHAADLQAVHVIPQDWVAQVG